jgi:hypothetical protein
MKPCKKVFSYQSGEDLFNRVDFDKRQINEEQITEGRSTGRQKQQIQGETNTNQRIPDQRRSKDQSRGTRTAPRRNVRGSEHIVKRDCSDD